ncbi:MAG: DUF1835 domain-containing protein [Acidobacteriota bacterium]|nr:DUF1835 domain-containing protein [Acidobacteriota bacterium]MDH3786012.1 DUF1835 domain-containing protein [Acidobacteriota bacterium]
MSRILHVTNGDSVVGGIRAGGIEGTIVPWRDVLHEGRVVSGLSLEEQSRSRARFLEDLVDESYVELLEVFRARDRELATYRERDEVWLWFEHDLYDQLQILQILNWFSRRAGAVGALSMICIDRFPGVTPFHGLGQLEPDQLASLADQRVPIEPETLTLAADAWRQFCGSDPTELQRFVDGDGAGLPFLGAALGRHLQQFPSTRDGLSRSERQILQALADGPMELGALFRKSQQEMEEAPFVGDAIFLVYVEWLRAPEPLIVWSREVASAPAGETVSLWHRQVELTAAGRQVLVGGADRTRFQALDRWLGGVHLVGKRPAYRCVSGRPQIVAAD